MIPELSKAIKCDLRQSGELAFQWYDFLRKVSNHIPEQCIKKHQWLFTGQKKHLSIVEKKEWQSKALIKLDNKQ